MNDKTPDGQRPMSSLADPSPPAAPSPTPGYFPTVVCLFAILMLRGVSLLAASRARTVAGVCEKICRDSGSLDQPVPLLKLLRSPRLRARNRPGRIRTVRHEHLLHANWLHLLGNLLFLFLVGKTVESLVGHKRCIWIILVAGVAGNGLQTFLNFHSVAGIIGGSGAISGLIGACLVLKPLAEVWAGPFLGPFDPLMSFHEAPIFLVAPIWFLEQVLAGRHALQTHAGGGIGFWAHVGGFAAGFLVAWAGSSSQGSTSST
jgi:membrane associated rhomboid family serine protease